MANTTRNVLGGAAISFWAAISTAAPAPFSSQSVVVHVVDYAALHEDDLNRAIRETSQIYAGAGVHLEWLRGEYVDGAEETARVHVRVILLPREMSDGVAPGFDDGVLGCAARMTGRAYVFVDRVAEHSLYRSANFDMVLGRVMAHELGHLLLPEHSHSAIGIMATTVDWRATVAQRFTAAQVMLLQRGW